MYTTDPCGPWPRLAGLFNFEAIRVRRLRVSGVRIITVSLESPPDRYRHAHKDSVSRSEFTTGGSWNPNARSARSPSSAWPASNEQRATRNEERAQFPLLTCDTLSDEPGVLGLSVLRAA